MLNLIRCELLKLKHSKMVLLSMAGVMATPFMMLVEALQQHIEHPKQIISLADVYSNSLLYVMLLVNLMIYVAITAYLFSREYSENTLKTILPIPVSRSAFIAGKFIVLFLWILMLTIFTWAGILILFGIYHAAIGLSEFYLSTAMIWLIKYIAGNTLVFISISPFAFIAEKTRGLVAPMIVSAVIVLANAALTNQKMGALCPWTATYLFMEGRIQNTGYPVLLAAGIIGVTSLAGFLAALYYFKWEDLK